ncbi:hypothetical protein A2U01_0073317, partial [Trifolium medium]|nr:hypothetical protein [Trifolium medium]
IIQWSLQQVMVIRAGFPSSTMVARVISHLDIFSKW